MPKPINLEQLLASNPGVNAERLKQLLEASQKLRRPVGSRYKYNLIPPFAGRLQRHQSAQVGGAHDDTRTPS